MNSNTRRSTSKSFNDENELNHPKSIWIHINGNDSSSTPFLKQNKKVPQGGKSGSGKKLEHPQNFNGWTKYYNKSLYPETRSVINEALISSVLAYIIVGGIILCIALITGSLLNL